MDPESSGSLFRIGIDIQCLDTIEEQVSEGLRSIQGLLIVFAIMDQCQSGHTDCEVLGGVIDTLGGQNDMDHVRYRGRQGDDEHHAFSLSLRIGRRLKWERRSRISPFLRSIGKCLPSELLLYSGMSPSAMPEGMTMCCMTTSFRDMLFSYRASSFPTYKRCGCCRTMCGGGSSGGSPSLSCCLPRVLPGPRGVCPLSSGGSFFR